MNSLKKLQGLLPIQCSCLSASEGKRCEETAVLKVSVFIGEKLTKVDMCQKCADVAKNAVKLGESVASDSVDIRDCFDEINERIAAAHRVVLQKFVKLGPAEEKELKESVLEILEGTLQKIQQLKVAVTGEK